MEQIPLWRPSGPHTSLDRAPLYGYDGSPLAEVCQAPPLLLPALLAELRAVQRDLRRMPAVQRLQRISAAGRALVDGPLGGHSADDCARRTTLATGLPLAVTRAHLQGLATAMADVERAMATQLPPGAGLRVLEDGWVLPPGGYPYVWAPRGHVLAVVAPNNNGLVHFTPVLALALGLAVLLRPGSQDVFLPHRLCQALAAAGLPCAMALAVAGHDAVPAMVQGADLALVYGSEDLERRWGGCHHVQVRGPGRSKVYVDLTRYDGDLRALADLIVRSIIADGGRRCTNTSAVIVRGDSRELRAAVAAALAAVPPLDPLHPAAQVPAWPQPAAAETLDADLNRHLATTADRDLTAERRPGPRLAQGGRATLLMPTLVACASPNSPLLGRELGFPFTCWLETGAGDPLPLLRHSLQLTLAAADPDTVQACFWEPSIRKLVVVERSGHGLASSSPHEGSSGHFQPGSPHEGLLSEFLFQAKACTNATVGREGETT